MVQSYNIQTKNFQYATVTCLCFHIKFQNIFMLSVKKMNSSNVIGSFDSLVSFDSLCNFIPTRTESFVSICICYKLFYI